MGKISAEDDDRRFFVYGLLPECEDQDLQKYFGSFGRVGKVHIARERETTISRCCGFVWMADQSLVPNILGTADHKIWDRHFQAKVAPEEVDGQWTQIYADLEVPKGPPVIPVSSWGSAKGRGKQEPAKQESSDNVEIEGASESQGGEYDGQPGWMFVGRLDPNTVEESIRDHFSKFGEVEKTVLLKDKDGYSKKCAYVKMVDPSITEQIIQDKEEHELDGQQLRVEEYSRDNKDKGKGKASKGSKFAGSDYGKGKEYGKEYKGAFGKDFGKDKGWGPDFYGKGWGPDFYGKGYGPYDPYGGKGYGWNPYEYGDYSWKGGKKGDWKGFKGGEDFKGGYGKFDDYYGKGGEDFKGGYGKGGDDFKGGYGKGGDDFKGGYGYGKGKGADDFKGGFGKGEDGVKGGKYGKKGEDAKGSSGKGKDSGSEQDKSWMRHNASREGPYGRSRGAAMAAYNPEEDQGW